MLGNDDRAIIALTALREYGVGVAFDDYETGYASLSLLKRFPLTHLKIDRSFVREMVDVDITNIRAILQLARGFGLDVIAEEVETPDQLNRLRAKGCTEGQGYLFAKPSPASDFEHRFTDPLPTRPNSA